MRYTSQQLALLSGLLMLALSVQAHGPLPVPLKNAPLPPLPPGLLDGSDPIIVDQQKAIQLGKALFWDMAVGSDGQACASCHFHAGADIRHTNQLNPGHNGTFDATASAAPGGTNYTLQQSDFPFHRRQDPFDKNSAVTFDSDDIGGSSGSFGGQYEQSSRFAGHDDGCSRNADPDFQNNDVGTRRVTGRNAPSVINAVFNHRNFWDGRANNVFNGSSLWGDRDPEAGVWIKINARKVEKQRLALINSSLASQALAPPLSDAEMSCSGRTFQDIGRKLLYRRPLAEQKVHSQDSVLGALAFSTETDLLPGLNTTYRTLVQQAFNRKYWSYTSRGPFGEPTNGGLPYNQMEANFPMFFGLAIQMYESTLISDDSPFDNATFDPDTGLPTSLGESVQRGARAFEDVHCNICHSGPAFTSNAILTNAQMLENDMLAFGPNADFTGVGVNGAAINRNVVNFDHTNSGNSRFFDSGFANTGVQDPGRDPGVAGVDEFGNPLSFADQYAEYLAGTANAIVDPLAGITDIVSCQFQSPLASTQFVPPFITDPGFFREPDIIPDPNGNADCFFLMTENAYIPTSAAAAHELANPDGKLIKFATQAAFKVPTLRNIELTGPYMHNGSMATLEEVVEFYARGGNFPNEFQHEFIFSNGLIAGQDAGAAQRRADLIAFLLSLTDERVRYERAPFDHPELAIPHGHDINTPNPLDGSLAADEFMVLPAVGSSGLITPVKTFEQVLAQ